jgi:hypothetical protein
MSTLRFLHVLVGMLLVGALIAAAVAALAAGKRDDERGDLLRALTRRVAVGALAATIVVIGLGEGLAADEDASGTWLEASRGLTVFGILLGSAALAVVAGLARSRPRFRGALAALGFAVVLISLATAFVMAAKPT